MRTLCLIGMIVVVGVGWVASDAQATLSAGAAQQGATSPPTIINFSSSVASITLAEAETETVTARLSWHAVNVEPEHRVLLHAYRLNQWEALLPDTVVSLPSSGDFEITVQHPLNFGPPTYRLSLVGGQGQVFDERTLVIPYDLTEDAEPPAIETFETSALNIDANVLAQGGARVTVTWQVANRQPGTHLVFEQVLDDGRAVVVEQPRPTLWVASTGSGVLVPVPPGSGQPVRLRLRLVDMNDGSTLDEQQLSVPVTGTVIPPTYTPVPTSTPGASIAWIDYFVAEPNVIDRGGTVTVSWQVINAAEVWVWLLNPSGQFSESAPVHTLTGSWTVTLGEYYTTSAMFMLFARDAAGREVQGSVTVQVRCPYTYFFGPAPNVTCPAGPEETVEAAFQPFENGYMIWRADTSTIYVLHGQDASWAGRYPDTWQEGEAILLPATPPEGLYAPVRGFGKVWADYTFVSDELGWATAPEQGYNMTVQTSGDYKYMRVFFTLPDGRVAYLVETSWGFQTVE